MSRMLKPAAAGLAISSLCLSFAADLPAQNAGKKKTPIKQTQAVGDAPAGSGAKSKTQSPSATGKSGQLERPQVQALQVAKPDPELEKVLKDWEKNTSLFKNLAGEFELIRYVPTFQVEKRAVGKFAHEAPDKGSYEKQAVVISKGQKPGKEGYKLESDDPERWVCTGTEVIKINDKDKTYEKMPIPPAAQGENMIEGPLPFLFGMKAERAKKRYKLKLVKKDAQEIKLEVIPRTSQDSSNWEKAIVIIDAKKYIPTAVRLFDPTGGMTTHIFKNVEINPGKTWLEIFGANPFAPKLRGYTQVQSNDKADPGERLTPPTNPRQSSAPGNKKRAATEGFDRSADASEAPPPRRKTGTDRK
ncbi:MAG TPA: hypothetical protein VGH74_12160 [Planctomycetaceae bacterium]